MWTALMLPSCSCFCSTALYSDAISLIIRELLWGETQETMPRFAVRISLRTSFLTSRCSLSEDPERKFDSGLRAGNGWASPELFSSKGPWQWLWPHHKLPSNWVVKSDHLLCSGSLWARNPTRANSRVSCLCSPCLGSQLGVGIVCEPILLMMALAETLTGAVGWNPCMWLLPVAWDSWHVVAGSQVWEHPRREKARESWEGLYHL